MGHASYRGIRTYSTVLPSARKRWRSSSCTQRKLPQESPVSLSNFLKALSNFVAENHPRSHALEERLVRRPNVTYQGWLSLFESSGPPDSSCDQITLGVVSTRE